MSANKLNSNNGNWQQGGKYKQNIQVHTVSITYVFCLEKYGLRRKGIIAVFSVFFETWMITYLLFSL